MSLSFLDLLPSARRVHWTGSGPDDLRSVAITKHPEEAVLTSDGWEWGLEWRQPRSIFAIRAGVYGLSSPASELTVQYWRNSWPQRARGGWTTVDDIYHGEWVTALGDWEQGEDERWEWRFHATDLAEHQRFLDLHVFYRQALKLRLLAPEQFSLSDCQVLSVTPQIQQKFRLEFGLGVSEMPSGGKIWIRNGKLLTIERGEPESDGLAGFWEGSGQRTIEVLRSDCPAGTDDSTVITIQYGRRRLSIDLAAAAESPVYLPDFGVCVALGLEELGETGWERWNRDWHGKQSISEAVKAEPEQSWERARREIPELAKHLQGAWGRYYTLAADSNRQEFAVDYSGHVHLRKQLLKLKGADAQNLHWAGTEISAQFLSGDPPSPRRGENDVRQSVLDDILPVLRSEWQDGPFKYLKEDFAALLWEDNQDPSLLQGNESAGLFTTLTVANTSRSEAECTLWLKLEPAEDLVCADGIVTAVGRAVDVSLNGPGQSGRKQWRFESYAEEAGGVWPERPRMALLPDSPTPVASALQLDGEGILSVHNALLWQFKLAAGEERRIRIIQPFETLTPEQAANVQRISFEAKRTSVIDYWRAYLNQGAALECPVAEINRFTAGQAAHIAIAADKDPLSGETMLPAATYAYEVCCNEAIHQIRSLDLRGYHDLAERFLEPFVRFQGSRKMHGRYSSAEGTFHGLKVAEGMDYQTFNYNLDHGFVMWGLAEHFFLTRDRDWLYRVAPAIVAACDFITRERSHVTWEVDDANRGLLPPGHLEDNPEWLQWFAVNAYAARGFRDCVAALRELQHPEVERLEHDCEAYCADVQAALRFNQEMAPAVRLRSGRSVPFSPTRTGLFGRDVGWIRDALYGPVHLVDCGVVNPLSLEAAWIMNDAEDNVFISAERGRGINVADDWFSQGGITIQSNLLPNPLVYLKQNEPELAIRAIINSFAQSIYSDVSVFTEHPVEWFGRGFGPFFKTPDEAAWITWLRHMFAIETDLDTLHLAAGIPREWNLNGGVKAERLPTYFGEMSLRQAVVDGKFEAVIDLPGRNPAGSAIYHLRLPGEMAGAEVLLDGKTSDRYDEQTGEMDLSGLSGRVVVTAGVARG